MPCIKTVTNNNNNNNNNNKCIPIFTYLSVLSYIKFTHSIVWGKPTFNVHDVLGSLNDLIIILLTSFKLLKPSGNFTYHQV
jgi:hypothetical protein